MKIKKFGLYLFIIILTIIVTVTVAGYLYFAKYNASVNIPQLINITTYTLSWKSTKMIISNNCETPPSSQTKLEGIEYAKKLTDNIDNKPVNHQVLTYAIQKENYLHKYCLAIVIPSEDGTGQLRYYDATGNITAMQITHFPK